jgi:hypothetical protein
MRIFILLFALVATSHAWLHGSPLEARRHDDNATALGIEKTCKRIEVLTKLNDLANNQTALDAMLTESKLAQARIDWIKRKSVETATELDILTANATLTAECDTISAQRDASMECRKLMKLEKLVDLANNHAGTTAVDMLGKDQKDRLQKKLEKAELKLQKLKSNTTLMDLCANDVDLQQNGAISNRKLCGSGICDRIANQHIEEVDNSGAIGTTKSDADSYEALSRGTIYCIASAVSIFLYFF